MSLAALTLKQDVFGALRFISIPLPQGTHWDMLPVLESYWKLFMLSNEMTIDSLDYLLQMLGLSAVLLDYYRLYCI